MSSRGQIALRGGAVLGTIAAVTLLALQVGGAVGSGDGTAEAVGSERSGSSTGFVVGDDVPTSFGVVAVSYASAISGLSHDEIKGGHGAANLVQPGAIEVRIGATLTNLTKQVLPYSPEQFELLDGNGNVVALSRVPSIPTELQPSAAIEMVLGYVTTTDARPFSIRFVDAKNGHPVSIGLGDVGCTVNSGAGKPLPVENGCNTDSLGGDPGASSSGAHGAHGAEFSDGSVGSVESLPRSVVEQAALESQEFLRPTVRAASDRFGRFGGAARVGAIFILIGVAFVAAARAMIAARRALARLTAAQVRRAIAFVGGFGLLTAGAMSTDSSPVAADNVGICPGLATTRAYDVQAISVDIPLNRYGNHDPSGIMYALTSEIAAIRAQEATQVVTPGLGEDPIQPLVIRANQGDCVEITLHNNANRGPLGMSIDGLPTDASGDDVGNNGSSEVAPGESRLYRYYVPDDHALEGVHYLHPGAGHRAAVDHGLFGALAVEPPGSQWLSQADNQPVLSGWAANIVPGNGAPAFRENVKIMHEVGNEDEEVFDKDGRALPQVDPVTEAYRPGGRALNYRSEPFMNRLLDQPNEKSHAYASTVFGDPPTIMAKGYVGEPTKFRVLHGGAEVFHVYHLHGGGDRWRLNPEADPDQGYADTGLRKTPVESSFSNRIDALSTGPGESFNAEIEGGAGGVQQAAGDFLFHCHIAEHYPSGMWGLWRVFDTRQPDVAPLPDRTAPVAAVTSDQLIGRTMPGGIKLTKANLAKWVEPQLPPKGIRVNAEDATVWNWAKTTVALKPRYLGEPEQTTRIPPNFVEGVPGHPGSMPVDQFTGSRPAILFNPINGRPAFPLLRPHSLHRPPFGPNEHSGAPYLGETADVVSSGVKPWANRADGLCPKDAPVKTFNVVAIQVPVPVTAGQTDAAGGVFTLADDKTALQNGTKPVEPLAMRANVGDCVDITLTSEQDDALAFGGFAKVEMHIHHVQFDPQGSDGTSAGLNFEHSIRPYKVEDTKLAGATAVGATSVKVQKVLAKYRRGVSFAVGLGRESIEYRTIVSVNRSTRMITLSKALTQAHAAGEGAGTEFIRYRWYADALLDNIFWHDHVDGIHGWGHGFVGMFIVEPRGSTYTDPTTGAPLNSGTIADIHYNPVVLPNGSDSSPLAPGLVDGDFREMVIWTLDDNPVTDSTINLRAEPFSDRGTDPSLRFSSYTWGDPRTPLLRAYPGDSVVIRGIHVGPTIDSFRVDGHHFYVENQASDPGSGHMWTRVTDTIHAGVSERFTLILDGGAGGPSRQPGDYLYHNGVARRFRQGAWGIMRVLPQFSSALVPLATNPSPGGDWVAPSITGGRPPDLTDPGNPCPAPAYDTRKTFSVSVVAVPNTPGISDRVSYAYVPSSQASDAQQNGVADPYVLHVNVGDCVEVTFRNDSDLLRAGFNVGEVSKSASSSGINVGWTPEQTVVPGQTRQYLFYVDEVSIEAALISDPSSEIVDPLDPLGGTDTGKEGLYGAIVVHEAGATFTNQLSGSPTSVGTAVDVHLGADSYRDVTLLLADDDDRIGSDFMPYPTAVRKDPMVNYRRGALSTNSFAGIPGTPIVQAYAGDPMKIHVLVAPGSEQPHSFHIGGHSWLRDPYMDYVIPGTGRIARSQEVSAQGVAPYEGIDIRLIGGAGGRQNQVRDYWYGDLRRPFAEGGMWGLLRVLSDPNCPIQPLDTRTCAGTPGGP